ncbi:MAG: sulfotransferase [Phycisphaerales bacterium]|nr:sulfotransferase [Phycisphaerales bacterium]
MSERQPVIRLRSLLEKPLQKMGVIPVDRAAFPAFLGIGAQKSGTTWLHENLSRHPSVFLPETKELHYFDWNFHRPLAEYLAHFKMAGDRLRGEITPGYATIDDRRVHWIRSIAPDLRIILLLRDPVQRAWSQAVMNMVEIAGVPADRIPEEAFLEHLAQPRVRLRNDYVGIIDRWSGAFGEDRLHVGFFEDVVDRPVELLQGILAFLGLDVLDDAVFDRAGERIRPGVGTPMPDRIREFLVGENAVGLRRLHERYGSPVNDWLSRYGLADS